MHYIKIKHIRKDYYPSTMQTCVIIMCNPSISILWQWPCTMWSGCLKSS